GHLRVIGNANKSDMHALMMGRVEFPGFSHSRAGGRSVQSVAAPRAPHPASACYVIIRIRAIVARSVIEEVFVVLGTWRSRTEWRWLCAVKRRVPWQRAFI